jgi:hypothetical protein
MSEPKEQSPAQKLIGDFSPKLVELTDQEENYAKGYIK